MQLDFLKTQKQGAHSTLYVTVRIILIKAFIALYKALPKHKESKGPLPWQNCARSAKDNDT